MPAKGSRRRARQQASARADFADWPQRRARDRSASDPLPPRFAARHPSRTAHPSGAPLDRADLRPGAAQRRVARPIRRGGLRTACAFTDLQGYDICCAARRCCSGRFLRTWPGPASCVPGRQRAPRSCSSTHGPPGRGVPFATIRRSAPARWTKARRELGIRAELDPVASTTPDRRRRFSATLEEAAALPQQVHQRGRIPAKWGIRRRSSPVCSPGAAPRPACPWRMLAKDRPPISGRALDVLQSQAHRPRRAGGAGPGLMARLAKERIPPPCCRCPTSSCAYSRPWPGTTCAPCSTQASWPPVNSDDPAYFGGYINRNHRNLPPYGSPCRGTRAPWR